MPGLVGLITKLPREEAEQQLQRMISALSQEPHYNSGTWSDPSLGIYVGWKAAKGSFADGMPVSNEAGDVILFFSGEEFPDPQALQQLKAKGHSFRADSASYLPYVYQESSAFPAALNGLFHGLVIDRRNGRAILFNDRYGLHRLYYHEAKDALYFAAEAKAVLAVRPELRCVDARGLGELIACGCVMEERTLFPGLYVLPPASAWSFANRTLERKAAYFTPQEWEQQEKLDEETYYQRLREVFARNLPRYFSARQPLAMSLTAGLDTRMIMAWHKPQPRSLPCYTFGSLYRDSHDVKVARQVAHMYHLSHQVIRVDREFLSRFPYYAERAIYLTDGCAFTNRTSNIFVNEKARTLAPVRLTGNYGGEVLRRVRLFKPEKLLPSYYTGDVVSQLGEAKATFERAIDCHPLSFTMFRQTPWHHYSLYALESSQITVRTPYLDNDFVAMVYRGPDSAATSSDISLRLIADGDKSLLKLRTDFGLAGSNGVRSRLSREVRYFSHRAEYAYDYGMPQWMAGIDHALSVFHPERLFLGRHKYFHYRVWFRDVLGQYLREMLLDPRTLSRPFVERREVESMVEQHVRGTQNHTVGIHQLLSLEFIHRLFIDRSEAA